MTKLRDLYKMSRLFLKIVAGILVEHKALVLCKLDISFCISYWVFGLSRSEFSERFLKKRKFLF